MQTGIRAALSLATKCPPGQYDLFPPPFVPPSWISPLSVCLVVALCSQPADWLSGSCGGVCVCVCVLHTAASVCMNVWTDLEVKWQLLFSSSERKCIFSLGRKDMMMMVIKTLKMMMGVPRPPRAQVSGCWYSVELFCGIYVCVLLRILLLSQTACFWFPVSSPFFVCCMFCMSFTPGCSSVVLHF